MASKQIQQHHSKPNDGCVQHRPAVGALRDVSGRVQKYRELDIVVPAPQQQSVGSTLSEVGGGVVFRVQTACVGAAITERHT